MGTHYKRAIFNDHLQQSIVGWVQKAKKRKGLKADGNPGQGSSQESANTGIQLGSIFKKATAPGDSSSAPKADGISSV
uniref:Uncharacterized protein n=1 Tax=Glycine max TaxID=3847 RepID=C6TFB7_SOYBN|nr:unknown [Glycine max]